MTTIRTFLTLPIEQIGELPLASYVGLIDETAIECLKVRLGAEGLLSPIWVRKNGNAAKGAPYSVIAGRHRLRAAKALGWANVDVEVRAGSNSDSDELLSLQIAENLDRRTLRPIEMALHIMQRWIKFATVANAPAAAKAQIDEAAASACGVSIRKVQEYRSIFEKLVQPFPEQFAQINAHPLGESRRAMVKIASLKHDDVHQDTPRRRAVTALLDKSRDWQSVEQLLNQSDIHAPTGRVSSKPLGEVMIDTWSRMPPLGRKAHVEWLAGQITPGQAKTMVATFKERGLL